MFIFHLEPHNANDRAWFAMPLESYIGKAIVRAPDEWAAREICGIVFGGYVAELDLDSPAPIDAAWSNHALVSCEVVHGGPYPEDGPIDVLFPRPLRPEARIALDQFARILATSPGRAT